MKVLTQPLAAILLAGASFFANPVSASSNLPEKIIVDGNSGSTGKESFSVSLSQINNSAMLRLLIYKPDEKRLSIRLRNADGEVIYDALTQKKGNTVGTDYNFMNAEEGTYTLEVSDGHSVVSKKIKLQHVKTQEFTEVTIK
jgi:hypothetical protein